MKEAWVAEAISLGLCPPPGDWWINHVITQNQRYKDRTVGSLDRATIEYFAERLEAARDYVGQDDLSDAARKKAYADLNALAQAASVLEKLKEHVREAHGRLIEQTEIPLSSAPEQEAGDPALEITDQTETGADVPVIESSEQAEPTPELVQINSDLLDPRFVRNAEAFMMVWHRARGVLDAVRDPWVMNRIIDLAEKLRQLADLFDLGYKLEMEAKALRFDALYKASQLFEPAKRGRSINGKDPDPLGCFSSTSKKVMALLRPYEPVDYQRLRDEGLKRGDLSEATFKKAPASKEQKQTDTQHLNPRRFLYDLLADKRINLTLSYRLDQIEDLANDPIILENLGPILDQSMEFEIALHSAVRRKIMEKEAQHPPLANPLQ